MGRRAHTRGERGAAMVIAMMVLLVLAGLGLVAMRFVRMETAAGGYSRSSRSAYHVAEGGVTRIAYLGAIEGQTFHNAAYLANPVNPSFTFAKATLDRSADTERLGRLEYIATMSRPRLAAPPPGYQVGGGVGNRMAFYVYQVDVTGTVNGDPITRQADPGGAAAVKQVRADVRFGPITINQ